MCYIYIYIYIYIYNFYSAYMLNIQAQRRNKHNHLASHTREQANGIIEAWNRRKYMVEMQFQTYMFLDLYESYP